MNRERVSFGRVLVFPTVLLLASGALYLFFFCLASLDRDFITTCKYSPYDRSTNPDTPYGTHQPLFSNTIRDFLFFWVIRALFTLLSILILFHSTLKKGYILSGILVFGGFFLGAYFCEYLKSISNDFECSRNGQKPNGVSGHTFYAVWAVLTFYYYVRHCEEHVLNGILASPATRRAYSYTKQNWKGRDETRVIQTEENTQITSLRIRRVKHSQTVDEVKEVQRNEKTSFSQVFWSVFIVVDAKEKSNLGETRLKIRRLTLALWSLVFGACLAVQLVYTYTYGYHSLQQMFYGAVFGLVWESVLVLASEVLFHVERNYFFASGLGQNTQKKYQ